MDDQALYGPGLHTLWFGEAVSAGLLTDYKVLVLAVDEKAVSTTFQAQMADESFELRLDDVAKIVGCWNGLAKRGQSEAGFATDPEPMTRAVAFARSIRHSQKFADTFRGIVSDYVTRTGIVDATTGTESGSGEEPLLLSNARCLSEGVDVPALDAVMFLNPRESVGGPEGQRAVRRGVGGPAGPARPRRPVRRHGQQDRPQLRRGRPAPDHRRGPRG